MTQAAPTPQSTPTAETIASSQMTAFRRWVVDHTGEALADDRALYAWSVADIGRFWTRFAEWAGVRLIGDWEPAVSSDDNVEHASFFPHTKLSYVEHLLEPGDADDEALVGVDETGARIVMTRDELRRTVARYAMYLQTLGVVPGERVAAIARNTPRTVALYLATLSLGAIWSSVAPGMGGELIAQRLGQVAPRVLFVDPRYPYHGAERDNLSLDTLTSVLPETQIITTDVLDARPAAEPMPFDRFPFNHPLVVLFSSGTTGLPKGIVHGAGGTLLEHLKELRLHCDLRAGDRLLFHTTTGWMMYNWMVSALATGATVVLYDGSVSFPDADALLACVARERVTVFGTSAAYLAYCKEAALTPRATHDFAALRLMLSTGSVLTEPLYDYAFEAIAPVPIHSISGGTDIVGCFVMGSPNLPVVRGESATRTLGLAVGVMTDDGRVIHDTDHDVTGELVCTKPFPSRPLYFWNDPEGARFHDSYFTANPGIYTHGDALLLTARGSTRILGRSDGVLNVRGVRIGPGEIYRVLETFDEIVACAAIEQESPRDPGGSRLVLLVVAKTPGALPRPLQLKLKKELSQRASSSHVPQAIVAVSDLPRTHNNKISERACRDAANGRAPRNLVALRNPEVVEEIMNHPEILTVRA